MVCAESYTTDTCFVTVGCMYTYSGDISPPVVIEHVQTDCRGKKKRRSKYTNTGWYMYTKLVQEQIDNVCTKHVVTCKHNSPQTSTTHQTQHHVHMHTHVCVCVSVCVFTHITLSSCICFSSRSTLGSVMTNSLYNL